MSEVVSYTVVSSTGEEHFADVPVEQALKDIKKQIEENSKWLYIGQNQETSETLTIEKLTSGQLVVLTDKLGGG
jgi:hypothetical protein